MNKQDPQFLLVDSGSGLKIVVANQRNFYSSSYAVQHCGTKEECKREMARLKQMEQEFDKQNKAGA